MMTINWDLRAYLDPSVRSAMQAAADICLRCEHIPLSCSIDVCLCDDDMIAEANRIFRDKDSSTDVLSFPSVSYVYPHTAGDSLNLLRKEYDDESCTCFLGDILISVPHIMKQAELFGHSELREAVYLLVHGICHLMGYDHIEIQDKERMRAMEEKIMSSLSITRDDHEQFDDPSLIRLAKEAMERSYSPYSNFPVGAALLCKNGKVYQGCNIENASFGLTNCAERTAVFKAVSEGEKEFSTIVIAARSKAWPCGACRQVLNEFAPGIRVVVVWDNQMEEKNLRDLLPEGFGPESIRNRCPGDECK